MIYLIQHGVISILTLFGRGLTIIGTVCVLVYTRTGHVYDVSRKTGVLVLYQDDFWGFCSIMLTFGIVFLTWKLSKYWYDNGVEFVPVAPAPEPVPALQSAPTTPEHVAKATQPAQATPIIVSPPAIVPPHLPAAAPALPLGDPWPSARKILYEGCPTKPGWVERSHKVLIELNGKAHLDTACQDGLVPTLSQAENGTFRHNRRSPDEAAENKFVTQILEKFEHEMRQYRARPHILYNRLRHVIYRECAKGRHGSSSNLAERVGAKWNTIQLALYLIRNQAGDQFGPYDDYAKNLHLYIAAVRLWHIDNGYGLRS